MGTREPWYDVALAVAESIGVKFEGVPDADHSGAFRAVNLMLIPMVLSFVKGTVNSDFLTPRPTERLPLEGCHERRLYGSMAIQPRRRSSPASCSEGRELNICS